MNKNPQKVLIIILNICTIYTKYLNQANNPNKKCNQIYIIALKLKQEFQISNNKKIKAINLLEVQIEKLN